MPKQKKVSKGRKFRLQTVAPEIPSPSDLEEFIKEASDVKNLTQTAGWAILERDLRHYQEEVAKKLAYINPSRKEFREAQVLYQAADKIIGMVNDYQENRDIAIQTLQKMDNPDLAVAMDVDTE